MEQIFLKVLNISISASILIIVVIAARLLLKKVDSKTPAIFQRIRTGIGIASMIRVNIHTI